MIKIYLKHKWLRIVRHIKEIGLLRFIFVFAFSLFVFSLLYSFLSKWSVFTISTLLILYVLTVMSFTYTRSDYKFLKCLIPKYKKIIWIDNILISIPFIICNYQLTPIILLLSFFLSYTYFSLLKVKNRKKRNYFMKGSIEWISAFRIYNKFTKPLWIMIFIFGCVYQQEEFLLIAIAGFLFDNYLFFMADHQYYIKQYLIPNQLIIDKLKRLYLNTIITVLLLFSALWFFEILPTIAFIIYLLYVNVFYLGVLFLKLSISMEYSRLTLVVVMAMYYCLFLISILYPILSVFIIIIVLLSYIYSCRILKCVL
jgi:hypothetical protein